VFEGVVINKKNRVISGVSKMDIRKKPQKPPVRFLPKKPLTTHKAR